MPSRSSWTPTFLSAVPQNTGTILKPIVAFRIAMTISSLVRVSPCTNFSAMTSSASTTCSIMCSRRTSASARSSGGISSSWTTTPRLSSSNRTAFMPMRSTTPSNDSPSPIGNCTGTGCARSLSTIMFTQFSKSAPTRSSLFTNASRGTLCWFAWRHTVSDCGSTPPTPQNTATAPSSTLSERSTSTVKSTWPGVSMMLIRWSCQYVVVAADVMVIPRSLSCGIQSMTAAPSCTSPIRRTLPV